MSQNNSEQEILPGEHEVPAESIDAGDIIVYSNNPGEPPRIKETGEPLLYIL
jgi:hypothetical protein